MKTSQSIILEFPKFIFITGLVTLAMSIYSFETNHKNIYLMDVYLTQKSISNIKNTLKQVNTGDLVYLKKSFNKIHKISEIKIFTENGQVIGKLPPMRKDIPEILLNQNVKLVGRIDSVILDPESYEKLRISLFQVVEK